MFGIGMPELIMILAVALLVLGPSRLPQVARTLGKGMREFRKASDDLRSAMWLDLDEEKTKSPPAPLPSLPAPSPAQSIADQAVVMVESSTSGNFTPESGSAADAAETTSEAAGDGQKKSSEAGMPRAATGTVARGSAMQPLAGTARSAVVENPETPTNSNSGDVEQAKSV